MLYGNIDENGVVEESTDFLTWLTWLSRRSAPMNLIQDGGSVVCKTALFPERVEVSTVFLGLDHSMGIGPRQWFETRIFGGEFDGNYERCATYDEARTSHQAAVDLVAGDPALIVESLTK